MALWLPRAACADIPDLVCQQLKVVHVNSRSLVVSEFESRDLYRFKAGKLLLSSPDRAEYLYGEVIETEPLRYAVGHKTLIFEFDDFRTAIFVHSYTDEIRVSRARCTKA
jgi:hypothetical protein